MKIVLQNYLTLLLFSLFTLSSCKKDSLQKHDKTLLSFKIEAKHNHEYLAKDIHAEIKDTEIHLTLPKAVDRTGLIATFSFKGRRVLIEQTEQSSAETVNNFEEPLTYVIEALNGSKQHYTLVVREIEDTVPQLNSFTFELDRNTGLRELPKIKHKGDSIWVRIKHDVTELVASFDTEAEQVFIDGVEQKSGLTKVDFSSPKVYTLVSSYGSQRKYTVVVERSSGLPHLYIDTEGGLPIVTKESYLEASIRIEGEGKYEDFLGSTNIRGRGNSTWTHPKKPYRLKFNEKTALFGLGAEKDWVLLSNYIDESLMLNAVAMKAGKLMGMPYTNTIIPVDLTVNGKYLGNYMLTEQVEVKPNRVNLDKDGILIELDTHFDEDYKFISSMYGLPVMMKYPKEPTNAEFEKIKKDFRLLENAMYSASFPNTNYLDLIDADALVEYLMLNTFTMNTEINHPKSVFVHKKNANSKYIMGPIWDFDWAFSYDEDKTHFISSTDPVFVEDGVYQGAIFFQRFLEDPQITALYKQKWAEFRQGKLSELQEFVDGYANDIHESFYLDYKEWGHGSDDFPGTVQRLKTWLDARAVYMDNYVSQL